MQLLAYPATQEHCAENIHLHCLHLIKQRPQVANQMKMNGGHRPRNTTLKFRSLLHGHWRTH